MPTYDNISEEQWLAELEKMRDWNSRHLLSLFSMLGIPQKMLDVGCGDGTMVMLARTLGVDAVGLDQLAHNEHGVYIHHNLVNKYNLAEHVSMVLCLEVAEHLDASAHATLCDTCAENLLEGRGNYMVFSAAFPNQGGIGHVSERPAKYWIDQLSMRGLNFRKDLTVNLSLLWSNIGSPLYWLPANVLVLEK